MRHGPWDLSLVSCLLSQELFYSMQIFWGIDTNRIMHRFQEFNTIAMLERTELLELLKLLQWRRLKTRKLEQEVALVAVKAKMLHHAWR